MAKQQFHRGDRVHIGKMPKTMSHFEGDVDAIVLYSYADEYPHWSGEREKHEYAVYVLKPGHGFAAWYDSYQLKKIRGKHGRRYADKLDYRG